MFKKILFPLCFAVCALAYPSVGHSVEWLDNTVEILEENLDEGSVMGAGVLYSASPYKGMDDIIAPVPIIVAEYKRFFIDESIMGFNLLDDEQLKVSVIAGPHFGGYDASESDGLRGMEDRDWGFDGGLRLKWKNDLFTFTAAGVGDLSDTYEGQEVSFGLSKELFEGFLTPRIGAIWSSEDAVDYYYGVRSSEAAAGRPGYAGDSTFNYLAGLTVAVPIGEKWAAVGDVQYQVFGDEITDSPIVDEDGIFRVTLGSVYRF